MESRFEIYIPGMDIPIIRTSPITKPDGVMYVTVFGNMVTLEPLPSFD